MTTMVLTKSDLAQNTYDRFLKTLCNKTRLAIIDSLRDSSKNVTELTRELGIHQTSVSHGLKRLLDCGFVYVRRDGKNRIYTLNQKTIKPLFLLMESHVNLYCKKNCCEE